MLRSVLLFAPRVVRTVGAPVLHSPCECVSSEQLKTPDSCVFTDDNGAQLTLRAAAAEMHETLDQFVATNGFGRAIAANQVGLPIRMIAVRLPSTTATILNTFPMLKQTRETQETLRFTLVNPTLKPVADAKLKAVWDDCFSFPEYLVRLYRHQAFHLSFELLEHFSTTSFETIVSDWSLSELLQHEIDHLEGITSFDRLEETFAHDRTVLSEPVSTDEARAIAQLPRVIRRSHLSNFQKL